MIREGKHATLYFVVIILAGLLINVILSLLVGYFHIPLFLDSVGTILATCTGGLLPGIIVGFLTNYLNSISDPISLYYAIISILIAVFTYIFNNKKVFSSLVKTLMAGLVFALIGGGLGSVLTWLLYGFSFGSGISAPFAIAINSHTGLGIFFSQLAADMGIDVADKLIVVIVAYLFLKYVHLNVIDEYINTTENLSGIKIRNKIVTIILAITIILSTVSLTIGYTLYKDTLFEDYTKIGTVATSLAMQPINAEKIDHYIETGYSDTEYCQINSRLQNIRDSIPEIKFLYVYKIMEDGCHVVFDTNTEEVEASAPGDIVDFDEDFLPLIPDLLAGKEIEAVVSDGAYGYLMTVYDPLYDSRGKCTAYVAADIDMKDVLASGQIFFIRMVSLLFGVTIIIVGLVILYLDKKLTWPLNKLTKVTKELSYNCEEDRYKNNQKLKNVKINTGDEIETLYKTLLQSSEDVDSYISEIHEKSRELQNKADVIASLQDNFIISFAGLVEERDLNTGKHIKRTAQYVKMLGRSMENMGIYKEILTPEFLENIEKSAPLHDIGKIKVPDSILNKPDRLTKEEFEVIKTHTTVGHNILKDVFLGIDEYNYMSEAMDMALYHHEKWNGTGYPTGIKETQIPTSARIMALADVLDALLSKRSYKEPMKFETAVDIIVNESGQHFDPMVVKAFLNIKDEIEMYAKSTV